MDLENNNFAVQMKNITKKFGDFTANDNIDLDIKKGEIHALLGENGAGKSTLMNILYGLYTQTEGEIYINGKLEQIKDPNEAIKLGLGMVHQHFMLIEPFTVVENIILGMEPTKGLTLNIKKATEDIMKISNKYGLSIDPKAKVEDITVGMQQRIEIIKALYRGADILIFDEPTAVLTPQEIDEFVDIIKSLSDQGKTIILITHKLKEIKAMADRCTIIRRGKKIDTVDVNSVSESELADMMVGRSVNLTVNKEDREPGDVVLSISNLIVKDARKINKVNGLNLDLKAGEIHGIAGVDGNGQSELLEALSGLRYIESGSITINGKDITNHTPKDIHENGIYNIPEDRQRRGLVLDFSVEDNLILENFHSEPFSKKGILNRKKINEHATELMEKFDIRPREPKYLAGSLSGGNQQKVIIAREITNNPTVLIAAQPTRGLDVGAIEYVHDYLIKQRDSGKAVLLISFELDEIMGLSDRISVIYGGKILKTLDPKNTNEKEIGLLMAGGNRNE
ncbi:ABC transporter, ATP-binding protein [Peptoniphilus duerdenii ATCC BAA-1640]|uniref:ABC transporter, ATP-binding protein n=1 Tax=Peptoniphilus duerdenii ATCC BAA-1640 TaxID=862517 RepID=E0NMI8_9FIRM|nr:ABC transporter ATP-binding protein [Peptoniphilus duerdenii]EFM25051.1 ABC transporter, ATP-binding protein [Peptoniphilus duerdenii ATCC BAA-1640]